MQRFFTLLLVLAQLVTLPACTYLKYAHVQSAYKQLQQTDPQQKNLKHMIDHQTFYVVGSTQDVACDCKHLPLAIAAFTHKYREFERVDTMQFSSPDTHFGLNLPPGDYELRVFADFNRDGLFSAAEVVGARSFGFEPAHAPNNVVSDLVLQLKPAPEHEHEPIASFAARKSEALVESLFYPGGSIRALADPLFDHGMSILGMYDPAAFLEKAPTMFYALEEDQPYKVPVIFVHGIGGSAREFSDLVAQLDRRLYKPWFFYYPSGGDLEQLGELFYRIFIAGDVIDTEAMPLVIFAHSMGGLIVREAMNHFAPDDDNNVQLIITAATPYGGHPAATKGVEHGIIVLPAWRDLSPDSDFIKLLFRKPLPPTVDFQLLYTYANDKRLKTGENSDGVVPLTSQLRPQAQAEAQQQFGFNATHSDVLRDQTFIDQAIGRVEQVSTNFPDDHLALIFEGGFDLPMADYSPITQYIVQQWGHYIVGLARGDITPFKPSQVGFVKVLQGTKKPKTKIEKELVDFQRQYPELFQPR